MLLAPHILKVTFRACITLQVFVKAKESQRGPDEGKDLGEEMKATHGKLSRAMFLTDDVRVSCST